MDGSPAGLATGRNNHNQNSSGEVPTRSYNNNQARVSGDTYSERYTNGSGAPPASWGDGSSSAALVSNNGSAYDSMSSIGAARMGRIAELPTRPDVHLELDWGRWVRV